MRPESAHTGGRSLDDGQEAYSVGNDANLVDYPYGAKQWALDPELAECL